ncbi:MAG: hypothetical protein D6761_02750 [Candidatus Dadabacteria bacterium]|nr:MAG: hypothetical protein D6761_02750 [Candidatus Dadabacteria bacterium]
MSSIDIQERTFCRICEAACPLVADVTADRVRLRPDAEDPAGHGYACAKGTRFGALLRHPERLTTPQVGRGTQRRDATWDEALRVIRDQVRPQIRQYGAHSVGIYFGNPAAFNSFAAPAMLALQKSLGSRNMYSAGSQDCNNKFTGAWIVYGSPVVHPLPDVERCDHLILFGSNPLLSQSSFVHLDGGATALDRLVDRGGTITIVDPVATDSVRRWGGHVPIRPGRDAWLLLSLLERLRDREPDPALPHAGLAQLLDLAGRWPAERTAELTGVAVATVDELAEKIASGRCALHMSVGVNQGGFGTLSYVCLQALMLLGGGLDAAGGNLFHPLAVQMAKRLPGGGYGDRHQRSRIGGYPGVMGTLPGGILADEILTPGSERIRTLICVAGDPLSTMADAGRLQDAFERLDLLVTVDIFASRTTELSDVVLPATTWLERFDVATTASTFQLGDTVRASGAVVAPAADARNDARILADLSIAIGRPLFGNRLLAQLYGSVPEQLARSAAGRAVGRRLAAGLRRLRLPAPAPGTWRGGARRGLTFWNDVVAAEAQRFEEASQQIATHAADELVLLGRRRRLGHNSWLHGADRERTHEDVAWIAPETAERLALEAAGSVQLRRGSQAIRCRYEVHEGVPPDTIVVPHGMRGANINALIPAGADAIEPFSGMHRMNGWTVQIVGDGAASRVSSGH